MVLFYETHELNVTTLDFIRLRRKKIECLTFGMVLKRKFSVLHYRASFCTSGSEKFFKNKKTKVNTFLEKKLVF